MKMEIERKFLVSGDGWRTAAGAGRSCEQGYISAAGSGATVRVRRIGEKGFLTLKGASEGIARPEFEYEIPVDEADYMLEKFCEGRTVSKTRYVIQSAGMVWEIDEFSGENRGLVLAEIELEAENQAFEKPAWLGEEVSGDPRYYNAALAVNSYSKWGI